MLEKEKQIEELVAKQSSLEQANVELQGKVAELEVKRGRVGVVVVVVVVVVVGCTMSVLILCSQKSASELESHEKDVKKTLALVKQRWSKSKGGCNVAGGHVT